MTHHRIGALLVLGGVALALALQVVAPVGVPLYDGVAVVEPYRYLHPGGGQPGDPTSFNATQPIAEGQSPTVAARTAEQPPQAQMIAQRGAFELTDGATAIVTSIDPVEPPAQPESGPLLGNAYRFAVTDQSGDALAIRTCSGCVSLVLRAPEGSPAGTLARYEGAAWLPVETRHAGTVGLYQTNPTVTGIYAIVSTGEPTGGFALGGLDLVVLLAVVGVALIFGSFVALLYLRARPARLPAAEFRRGDVPRPPPRAPSRKKRSRRPPSGRSGS